MGGRKYQRNREEIKINTWISYYIMYKYIILLFNYIKFSLIYRRIIILF